jgi:hypothetical protein
MKKLFIHWKYVLQFSIVAIFFRLLPSCSSTQYPNSIDTTCPLTGQHWQLFHHGPNRIDLNAYFYDTMAFRNMGRFKMDNSFYLELQLLDTIIPPIYQYEISSDPPIEPDPKADPPELVRVGPAGIGGGLYWIQELRVQDKSSNRLLALTPRRTQLQRLYVGRRTKFPD